MRRSLQYFKCFLTIVAINFVVPLIILTTQTPAIAVQPQVAAGWRHTVGLKSDGKLVAGGSNVFGQCDVDSWTDIIQVATGYVYTVGLKSDGTVVAAGNCFGGACDVDTWNLIVTPDAMSWMLLLLLDI